MLQICVMADFKHQVLQYDDTAVPIKDPRSFLGQEDLTISYMFKMVIQTAELVFLN